MKTLKKLKRYLLCKNYLGRCLYILYVKRFLVKLKNDEVGLICDLNLGETYLFCSMLDDFKAEHNIKKVVLISERWYYRNICEMFDDRIDRSFISSAMYSRPFRSFREIKEGSFYFIYDHTKWSFEKLLESGKTHLEQLKITSGISYDAVIKHHINKEVYKNKAKDLFEKLELKQGKTVLISPEAKSCKSLDKSFYQALCNRFKEKGYSVFINLVDTCHEISDEKSVFLSLAIAVPFCDLCGHVVAIRSGFCDVISSTKARFHIIYPDQCFSKVFPMKEKVTSNYIREYFGDKTTKELMIESISNNI